MPRTLTLTTKYGSKPKQRAGVFQYRMPPRPDALDFARVADETRVQRKEEGPFTVQGQKASDLEWRVYKALKRLGWGEDRIDFQQPILGGRMPGGQVLDFVLYGAIVYVINVNGDHWHKFGRQGAQSKIEEAAVTRIMPSARMITLWSGDLQNDEMAYNILNRLVGRGQ